MPEKKVITFSGSDTFDSGKIEIVNSQAQLKSPFATDNPTIETSLGFKISELQEFVETATKPANTEIKYIIKDGNTKKYFDSTSKTWVVSDGTYAQSNLATEIDNNRQLFYSTNNISLIVFLHSDGSGTPVI